jgi:hypothetical protein
VRVIPPDTALSARDPIPRGKARAAEATVKFRTGETTGVQDVLATFPALRYHQTMSDAQHLQPATPDEIADALSFALQYQGAKVGSSRRRHDGADYSRSAGVASGTVRVRTDEASCQGGA